MTRDDLYSFANLWRQYRVCRRNKRNTINQLRFEIDAEAKLLDLQRELREHTYRPGRSICFVTGGPKRREVFAADFRDRIVHHVLVSRTEPVFERRFIHDSYACRPAKGVLAASDRLMEFLRRITANGKRPAWTLKLDIASFFCSIDKEILDAIITRPVRDPELRWLTRVILFHDAGGCG
jgi:RNA-directed DNA polymerase